MANEGLDIVARLRADATDANGKVEGFRSQLLKARDALIQMNEKFGSTSKEAQAVAQYAGELYGKIREVRQTMQAFNPEQKFAAFGQSIRGVVGGFEALQGVIGLSGVKSEELEKTLLRVQSAMAISQGLNEIQEASKAWGRMAAVVQQSTIFIKANEVANKAAAGAMRLFGVSVDATSTSFKVLKGAIAATGIGLLVVAIGEAISFFDDLINASEKAAEAEKHFQEENKKIFEEGQRADLANIKRREDYYVALAKSQGKSEEEIFKIQQYWEGQRLALLKRGYTEAVQVGESGNKEREEILDQDAKMQTDALTFKTEQDKKAKEQAEKAEEKRKEAARKHLEQLRREHEAEERREAEHQRRMQELRDGQGSDFINGLLGDEKKAQDDQLKAEKDRLDASVKLHEDSINAKVKASVDAFNKEKDLTKEQIALSEEERNERVQFAYDIANATGALADLVGQQTAAGKVLGIATATINTWIGATEVLRAKSALPEPMGTISKIANVAAIVASGLKSVKQIMSVKVPGSSGSANIGSVSTNAPLTPQLSSTLTTLDQNTIDNMGNKAVRAFVTETDITTNQEAIRRINRAARIG